MSQLNPLNDLSRVYLDKVALMNRQEEQNDVERWQGVLDDQMEKSSKKLATLGAPTMEEEKKAAKDYDGDGKVESGKDEYFGSKDKAIKKAMKKEDTDNYVEAYVDALNKTSVGVNEKVATGPRLGEPREKGATHMNAGEQEKISKRTKEWMGKQDPPMKGAPGGDAMKAREAEHRAKRGVKKEELELDEAERSIADRLERKNKLYDKTTSKAMDDAWRTGEASGHNRFNMSRLGDERDKLAKRARETKSESMQHRRNPEGSVKDRFKSRQTDPSKDNFTGIGDDIGEIMRQNAAMKKAAAAKKKVKEGRFSDWRDDLSDLIEVAPMTDVEMEKEVTEKKVNNKVVINPKMSEAVAAIGGQVISETQMELDEKHKDTPDQVKAVIAYDRARHATDDATYDTEHGKKKQAKKERDYAKWQRDTGARDAQKSGHPWEHEKYGTREKEGKKSVKHAHVKDSVEYILDNLHDLNEADIADILARLEKKRIRQGGDPDESPLGKKTGRAMKDQQDKARKKAGMSEGVLGTKAKGILGKEVKELEKASYTMKDTPVVKADKTDTPNYKGNKFGVKEKKDWIQGAVKRPGAFTRKAKAAGMSVQQFAAHVDKNKDKYSTRTERQANLAQTFASMKKEDVEELFYTLIVD